MVPATTEPDSAPGTVTSKQIHPVMEWNPWKCGYAIFATKMIVTASVK